MKIIKVHDCAECPNRKWSPITHSHRNYCQLEQKDITDVNRIQGWCPLDDYPKRKEADVNA